MPQNAQQAQQAQQAPPQKKKSLEDLHLDELLELIVAEKGTDLHITPGIPPIIRVNGELLPTNYENCTPRDTQMMMYSILTDEQIQKFESTWELDFSYAPASRVARFRVNIFKDRGSIAAALRVIPTKIPTLEELGLPPVVETLTHTKRGLILVTGPTGSGKSTTLAAMINHINVNRSEHILTIEDPIEYLHTHKLSVINQRELGMDTKAFNNALRAALREDPDVILVGEMRDTETMQLAVSAAETGHLVFATLHTNSAATSVDRIVDSFPEGGKEQVRLQLSNNLQAIISQQLVPTAEQYKAQTGKGRVGIQEIMVATAAIRNLIREAKAHQMTSIIQTSAKDGMITTDQALRDYYFKGVITYEMALSRAQNMEELKRMMASAPDPNSGNAGGGHAPGMGGLPPSGGPPPSGGRPPAGGGRFGGR
ncbi:MAG: type IV pilus twitching motility protein PilT [Armatimonadetes bacterium]|nr:type IV pilus twitching motility protein PilT [Armatimonadota bacterium]